MTVLHDTLAQSDPQPGAVPQPLPPDTVAVVEDVFRQVLHGLRACADTSARGRDAGTIEYASWMRLLR